MKVIVAGPAELGAVAAAEVATHARDAVAARGRVTLAVSGGGTPRAMFEALATMDLPWEQIDLFQVDERAAPDGHHDRNLEQVKAAFGARPLRVHAMPVGTLDAEAYAFTLRGIAGDPPVLDLVHLGLGGDGHTASLVPGDPVLDVADADVAVTGVYNGWRRMTLTFPALNRARAVLWLVGADKRAMIERVLAGDTSIPGGRVSRERATLVTDAPM